MSMSQVIQVEKVNKYGSDLIYPRNALAEKACALLNNQKTLTAVNISRLKAMGFIVKQVVTGAGGQLLEVGDL